MSTSNPPSRWPAKLLVWSCLIVTVLLCVLLTAPARAQYGANWRPLGTITKNKVAFIPQCIYFFDTKHGVAGGSNAIYYCTNDTDWKESVYPEPFGDCFAIRRLDNTHLYAAAGANSIWVSSDSGATWQTTGIPAANAGDVFRKKGGAIGVVSQNGKYAKVFGDNFARFDSNVCFVTPDDNLSAPGFSYDGGQTWQVGVWSGVGATWSGFGLYADPCSRKVYTISEYSPLFVSSDSGRTWSPIMGNPLVDNLEGID